MPDVSRALLPAYRSTLESAVVDAVHTAAHPIDDIRTLYRPELPAAGGVSAPLLPWLAWARDVLVWPRGAGETLQRQLTRASWQLHRRQGTLAGLRDVAGVFGAEIVRAITPPSKSYLGARLTTAQRNDFLSRYPQLRIYPRRLAGVRVGAMLQGLHLGAAVHPVQTDAALRLAPQAFVYRDGRETPLQAMEREIVTEDATAVRVLEVRAAGQAGPRAFCGRHVRWLAQGDAAARMYRLTSAETYTDSRELLHRQAIGPGLQPITPRYDWVMGHGQERGLFAGRHVAGHLVRSTAPARIFKRTWLLDPAVSVVRRGAMSFTDATRLGMPAHHAELAVRLRGQRLQRAAGRYLQGYLVATPLDDFHSAAQAMRTVARVSDRIALDLGVTRPFTAGESRRAGTATAGEWRDAIA